MRKLVVMTASSLLIRSGFYFVQLAYWLHLLEKIRLSNAYPQTVNAI
jgi:hypothetical protein